MKTFADWVRYYNDLDVVAGLEALEKIRAFFTDKGIDISKDAVLKAPRGELAFSLKRQDIARG